MEWKPDPEGGRPQMVEVPGSTEVLHPLHFWPFKAPAAHLHVTA